MDRQSKWAQTSPLSELEKLNETEDPRHTRRALTVEQLRALLQKTAEGRERYGMTRRERHLLYRTAVETGLRAGELRRLRKADFDFDAQTVTVRAVRATKSKHTKEQTLSVSLCAALREFLAKKLPDAKAFGGSYAALTVWTSPMLREDLRDAGIPYKDDRGRCFDFHSLRGETASLLIDAGVDPKQAQEIMRHSTIGLTMDVYAKVLSNKKKAQAIVSLPDLSLPESQRQSLAKTGTDDLPVNEGLSEACLPVRRVESDGGESRGKVLNSTAESPFLHDQSGSVRTENPCVAGSREYLTLRGCLPASATKS